MRATTGAALCLFTLLSISLSAHNEPAAQSLTYFAAVYNDAERPYLLGSFKPGRNVTILNEKEMCKAKTGSAFSFDHIGDSVKATNLTGSKKYPNRLTIAVVGAGAESVQMHVPEEIHSPLPPDVALKTRQFVKRIDSDPEGSISLANRDPQVLRVGRFTLLKFKWKGVERGPSILSFDDQFFQLEVDCTSGHVFFSVNGRLYLAYHEGGCFNGRDSYCVYDLSGSSPKRVYCDGLST